MCVEQGGQAAGSIITVCSLDTIRQRHRDQADGGIVVVRGRAGGPVGDADEAA